MKTESGQKIEIKKQRAGVAKVGTAQMSVASGRKILKKQRKLLKKESERVKFSRKKLVDEIVYEARILNIHKGAAELVAMRVAREVEDWAEGTEVGQRELNLRVAKALKRYNRDLAFLYQQRGSII